MDSKFLQADELGIRLEMVGGLPIWEPHPVYKHQKSGISLECKALALQGSLQN